jgi:hypothetical protein
MLGRHYVFIIENGTPSVNVIPDLVRALLAMCQEGIFPDPGDKVVLKRPFDDLMKKIGGKEFVDVCAGEVVGERLETVWISFYIQL